MKNIFIYILLLSLTFSCDGQIGTIIAVTKSTQSQQEDPGIEDDVVGENTTEDQYQVIWGFGDSEADGRSPSITTVPSATLYVWNGSGLTEVTTQSICNDSGHETEGGWYQNFAIDYKAATGYKVVLVQSGYGGTTFADWDGSGGGDHYATEKAKLDACLSFLNLTRPKYIYMSLGTNDLNGTFATSQTAFNAVISNVTTDYPDVPIAYWLFGRNGSVAASVNVSRLRDMAIDKCIAVPNLHIVGAAASFIGAGYLQGDNTHYTATGTDMQGEIFNRWISNKTITNKWARSVVSSHFDVLNANRTTLITDLVTWLDNNGYYGNDLESFHWFKTTIQNNIYLDWSFQGYMSGAITFSANSHIASNGTSHNMTWTAIPGTFQRATATNFRMVTYLSAKTTANGTLAYLFGVNNAANANQVYARQNTSSTEFSASDGTASAGPEAGFVAGHSYGVARNGTTVYQIKDATATSLGTVSATTASTVATRHAANNNNGTINGYIAAQFKWNYAAKETTFDHAEFETRLTYMEAHWND